MEKINRIKQISKNITIVGSTLSLTSSTISGGLSLSGYSQEGGFLSLAGNGCTKVKSRIGDEKFYRDRRSFRESWIELVDIYEDLYLLSHISKNFPVEVDEALSNFVEVLSKVNQVNYEQNDEENEELTIKKESSNIVIEDTTRPYFIELNSINIQLYTTMSGFTHRSLWENTSTKSDTVLQPVSQCSETTSYVAPATKENILKDKELLKKWKENGNNIAEKIKELVEKIDAYRKKLVSYSLQFQNSLLKPQLYQYPSSQPQPNQYPPFQSSQSKPYQYLSSQPQPNQYPPLQSSQSRPYQYPSSKSQPTNQYPPLKS
ncbi:uncharacterized protein OCT59_028775 [Rhizophagus irregularis]|uniref:Uncharacterized protein n=2 Tax=Rhizophagus irregularis TaxID=588596 RepID=U9U2U4_RHIID|nr:hypothetical protein GLOIN_2v1792210 [Rhizophagus irregularis DAOM 181602=DAOM 197198]EXX77426.1 hypothetical protein RirG_023870 [Rhizophagus irregularis DAOM 197198w]UZO08521.1 hypothetical protein OCT59_028775 [Rhizophagus irregularis]POG53536.1 hypothetical protein GLOIN_2v1792210 [Rhizophagus irregularis DAOM 181602=DAOM 197198]CAG8658667.1 2429_t:CDS:2 [Rhizophagus irregularis]GBC52590.2 hypothetical protein GLOIN_2v1792210 [Rhizophagus irregularis DAOM 181602=DAOM 197198]|eukprot:XP_025164143.1 hypothetical protein GLOIN_2v1792210 [Rhizophagus irregularis DAOM 181602=DAOM 197198]